MSIQLYIEQDDRTHVIDNSDTRELTEQRLRLVYDDMTDQEVEDFLDVFYEVKAGAIVEGDATPTGCKPYRALLS